MGDQLTFDLKAGQRRRDEGMARALERADDDWREALRAVAIEIIEATGRVCADDVTARIGLPPPPASRNCVGAALRAVAKKQGWLKIGTHNSERPERHAGSQAVWGLR